MAKRRNKNPLKREFSAGGVVYRGEPECRQWLIIKPSRFAGASARRAGKEQWRLPKGLIDKGETSLIAAQREVEEEGGIETEVLVKIGQDKYFYQMAGDRFYKIVTYYLMRYQKAAKGPISWETEEVSWLPFDEAYEKLTFKGEKEMLRKSGLMIELR